MNEKMMQSEFTWWAKHNISTSTAFELKICKGKSLPYSNIKEHQLWALFNAKHTIIVHKISDMSYGYKPFDCFALAGAEAYLVVMFYKKGKKHSCILIEIDVMMKEITRGGRRSLTEERALEIGREVFLTKRKGGGMKMEEEKKEEEATVEGEGEVKVEEEKKEEETPAEEEASE